jgi:hypothetical protein
MGWAAHSKRVCFKVRVFTFISIPLRSNCFLITADSIDDDAGTAQFAMRAADILIDILQGASLGLTMKSGPTTQDSLLATSGRSFAPLSRQALSSLLARSFSLALWTTRMTGCGRQARLMTRGNTGPCSALMCF